MSRVVRIVLIAALILMAAGLVLPLIIRARAENDRVNCENHLRELGLIGMRHASAPGEGLPPKPRDEFPPGTFLNPALPADQRMSWYVYMLNVLNDGSPNPDPEVKHHRPAGLAEPLKSFDAKGPWDSPANSALANYRLATAICPAQIPNDAAGNPVPTNYIANGGLGVDTPALPPDAAGTKAGAFWYDGPTPPSEFRDGLQQTALIIETNFETGPWLRGGPSTLRGLDVANAPYVGVGRPFGGCHPGGCNASMADGSVRFIKETIDPAVFRALLTRAGGPEEMAGEVP
jgi:prepilin-type processing-associated H-X9-DG protein